MLPASVAPETLHPSLWRGGQLARGTARCVDTGHALLTPELPGGGWPMGALTDLLISQAGIGELRLLLPVFKKAGKRPVALIQPPYVPNTSALAWWDLPTDPFLVLRPTTTADALWATEQVLKAGTCSTVMFWQKSVRSEALRRLHVVAQGSESLFFVIRPEYAAGEPSPAPLRLGLKPGEEGLLIDFLKRRGPGRTEALHLPLTPQPALQSRHPARPRRGQREPARTAQTAHVIALHG